MKNKRICPKCNSTDILPVPGKAGAYQHTNGNDHILRRPCPSLCLLFLRLFGRMDRQRRYSEIKKEIR